MAATTKPATVRAETPVLPPARTSFLQRIGQWLFGLYALVMSALDFVF